MNILLTGARGFVGARIAEALPEAIPSPSLQAWSEALVASLLRESAPDVIIHTAAISDIGVCERDPALSYRANVALPLAIAKYAPPSAKLIFFSSDQVYTGCRAGHPFRETDVLSPTNTYAVHKLQMESEVASIAPTAVFLRATWMFDMPLYGSSKRSGFLFNLLRSAVTRTPSAYSTVAHRGMTYVREISEQIRGFFDLPGGAYNLGSENPLTVYETAVEVLRIMGADTSLAIPDDRGTDLAMCGQKLRDRGIDFSVTTEACRRCLRDYRFI